jgi:TetR/AcrR family transcriptional repressor of mexJK operon
MAEKGDSRPKGRPLDQEKRSAILNASRELFLSDGFAVVSMDAIAKRAGVSKATVYSHFEDKNALFRAVLTAETKDYEAPPIADRLSTCEELRLRLTLFGTALLSTLTRPGVMELGRLLITEAHHHADLASDFYAKGPGATHRLLADLFKSASDDSLIACDQPELAADQLLSMWLGQRHLRQQLGLCPPPAEQEITRHVEACVDLILAAFALDSAQQHRKP